MTLSQKLLALTASCILFSCHPISPSSQLENLLDKDLSKWEVFLGVPHKSTGIPGYETVENVRQGKPLGLGNQRNIFSVSEDNGELILAVTGEIFGSLASKAEYENYHLTLDIKWGEKRWEPRLNSLYNNGLLYHSIGEPGAGLWNTWMTSLELEIEATNFGDYISINDDNVRAKCPSSKQEDGRYYYDPKGELREFWWKNKENTGRCYAEDVEKPKGEWNTVELLCYNGKAIHIVNGQIVMEVEQAQFYDGQMWIPMKKGKLQLQSEGAETFFKHIKIRPIDQEVFETYSEG